MVAWVWKEANAEAMVAALSMKFGFELEEAAEYLHGLGVLKKATAEGQDAPGDAAAASGGAWERVSGEGGAIYFYNPTTGDTSWTDPRQSAPPPPMPRSASMPHVRGMRTASSCEDGHADGFEAAAEEWHAAGGGAAEEDGTDGGEGVYYYNERTQEACWAKPQCMLLAERTAGIGSLAAGAAKMLGLTESSRAVAPKGSRAVAPKDAVRQLEGKEASPAPSAAASVGAATCGGGHKRQGSVQLVVDVVEEEKRRVAQLREQQSQHNPFSKDNYYPSKT